VHGKPGPTVASGNGGLEVDITGVVVVDTRGGFVARIGFVVNGGFVSRGGLAADAGRVS